MRLSFTPGFNQVISARHTFSEPFQRVCLLRAMKTIETVFVYDLTSEDPAVTEMK